MSPTAAKATRVTFSEPCQRALSPIRMSTTSRCKLSMYGYVFGSVLAIALRSFAQCRINNGANGAAAPGPPQLGAPHKGFFFCTLILPGTLFEANFIYIIAKMRSLPDPAGGLTAPPRPPAVLHAAYGSVGLGHRGSHSPREKPPTKVLHQALHIGNPALPSPLGRFC